MSRYAKSKELYERACKVLAGGVSSEFRKFNAPHPLFYSHGQGSHVVDVDGNDYLDFTLSQGPLILGHSHPHVLASVNAASESGQLFAGQHLLELELAERLSRMIPCAEMMRFSLSGSEADHSALRLARGVTGRNRFLRFEGHYHGWLDNASFGVTGPNVEALGPREAPHVLPWTKGLPAGITDEAFVLPWNDLALVERLFAEHGGEIAAVITEPVMCNNGCIPPEPGFLEGLRALCTKHGSLLVFDEVITGFRTGLGGAQTWFGVTPDLAVFGKAMASGYPISVLCGQRDYMQLIANGTVIHAGTMNSGNPTVAAALATLDVLEKEGVPARIKGLGLQLMEGLREVSRAAGQPFLVQGLGPMFHCGFHTANKVTDLRGVLGYDRAKYAAFVGGMQDRGIRLIGRGLWYISGAHTEADIDTAIKTSSEVLKSLAKA